MWLLHAPTMPKQAISKFLPLTTTPHHDHKATQSRRGAQTSGAGPVWPYMVPIVCAVCSASSATLTAGWQLNNFQTKGLLGCTASSFSFLSDLKTDTLPPSGMPQPSNVRSPVQKPRLSMVELSTKRSLVLTCRTSMPFAKSSQALQRWGPGPTFLAH